MKMMEISTKLEMIGTLKVLICSSAVLDNKKIPSAITFNPQKIHRGWIARHFAYPFTKNQKSLF